ncbi:hypothetical protein DFH11DRAFT_1624456 [Phellopilus nigrolimitatus]|nr:hypothetical protein DFH11DRAFT_1624456 [Phellopilus nigrolimitatus]
MDQAAVDETALPEGACITAEIPNTAIALLGAIVNNPYRLAPLTAVIRDGASASDVQSTHLRCACLSLPARLSSR